MAARVDPYLSIRTAALITDRVLAFTSGGKDSVANMDLCFKHFKQVQPVFMQLGPVLSFQRAQIRWTEDRYGVEVLIVPHPMLSDWMRWGLFRSEDFSCPRISFLDVYTYVRCKTGIWWIAAGERASDSRIRRAQLLSGGGSVNWQRGRFFPLVYWGKQDVLTYVRHNKLKITPESSILGYSFRGLMPADVWDIRKHFPRDYDHLEEWFPDIEVSWKRHEAYGQEKAQ